MFVNRGILRRSLQYAPLCKHLTCDFSCHIEQRKGVARRTIPARMELLNPNTFNTDEVDATSAASQSLGSDEEDLEGDADDLRNDIEDVFQADLKFKEATHMVLCSITLLYPASTSRGLVLLANL